MSDTVIKVENLGKKYLIRHQQSERYTALRDVLTNKFKSFGKRLINLGPPSSNLQPSREEFWALKDVSFEVKQGNRIGIIGRNGAGKTTLLKLLSRITEPTTGRIAIKGRVASLLEVGTGFHPELTGRENIFLNGAILGMSKAEIKKKFDEIVDFAEIEKFLDTPVKRYSSGMYVRLAFAVAAHLEPEILLVDEVLAVGDTAFQKKCLGKMEDVSTKDGKTVLLVSHNMGLIRQLCNECLLLREGKLDLAGKTYDIVPEYEKMGITGDSASWFNSSVLDRQEIAYIEEISLFAMNNENKVSFLNSEPIYVKFVIQINQTNPIMKIGLDLIKDGSTVFRTQHIDYPNEPGISNPGRYEFICEIPPHLLNAGEYFIQPLLSLHYVKGLMHNFEPILSFRVTIDTRLSAFYAVLNDRNHPGAIFPSLKWRKKSIQCVRFVNQEK